jgi:ABC-2 type transport system ATP-binding protein
MQETQEATSAIIVEHLVKRYRRAQRIAVDDISFSVRRGETFGLLGPNGAGKTTTIGILTTSVLPNSGRATIAGIDVVTNAIGAKQRIAVVPQRNNLDRTLRINEILTYHAAYHGVPRAERTARATTLLEELGLSARRKEKLDWLSGGLWERIRALRERGVTIVLTTHDMEEAGRLCERIAIMDQGRVLALDTPDGLKRLIPGGTILELRLRVPEMVGTLRASEDGATGTQDERFHTILGKLPGITKIEQLAEGSQTETLAFWILGSGFQVRTDMPGVLIGLMVLVALVGAALGLVLGTAAPIQMLPLIFALVLTPLMFTGCTFYPWTSLDAIKWFQVVTLFNPLTYAAEGMRYEMVPPVQGQALPTLAIGWVLLTLCASFIVCLWVGLKLFQRCVVS